MKKSISLIPSLLLVGAGVGLGLNLASDSGVLEKFPFLNSATAQESPEHKVSPVAPIPEREMYYPGTEKLACGNRMPNARPKKAAACWLVELGNGDKFHFEIGTGSAERIPAMQIPYNF